MTNYEQDIRALLEKRGKSGVLQQLAEYLLKRETNWKFISHPGILEGTPHPIKGKIDLWFQDQDGNYIAVQPTSDRSRSKLEKDTRKGIFALEEIISPPNGKVVLFCSRDIDVADGKYCEKLCTSKGIKFEFYNNSYITSLLLEKQNSDLVEKYLEYKISHKKPVIEVEPVNKELYNHFEYIFKIKNIGDDYLSLANLNLTRNFSEGKEQKSVNIYLNRSIEANGGTIEIDISENIRDGVFNSFVTQPNQDYIMICLTYKDSNDNEYKDYFKYSFSRIGLKWNQVLIEKIKNL
ncbi:hypothetical protein [Peribacillus simplex]|uniref:hypothetical protein n=1 Tax=Peribacillus simplex TaxID=1478 RepID=UPI0024C0E79E|nr:hypothetical protein [Peribacillus simplex]WHY58631.1 hypothetical protein QNH43_10400 [Peribacillus simplex]